MFDCPINKLILEGEYKFTIEDVGMAIRETKRYLTGGKLMPIMVRKCRNGRYSVQTNVVTYVVAHTLSLPTVPVQVIQ